MILGGGTYDQLEISSTQITQREDGNDEIRVRLHAPDDFDAFITDYLSTKSEKAFEFTKKRLDAYGWNPEANNYAFSVLNLDGADNPLVGKLVGPVVIEEQEYPKGSGKFNARVVRVGDEQPLGVERMPETEAKAFEARLRAKFNLGAAPSKRTAAAGRPTTKTSRPAPAPAAPAQATGTEDDFPY